VCVGNGLDGSTERVLGVALRSGGLLDLITRGGGEGRVDGQKKPTYIDMVERCNLHEIAVNRGRKPGGAVD